MASISFQNCTSSNATGLPAAKIHRIQSFQRANEKRKFAVIESRSVAMHEIKPRKQQSQLCDWALGTRLANPPHHRNHTAEFTHKNIQTTVGISTAARCWLHRRQVYWTF
eukprot:gb/GECG01007280.1/.p1 GENE.gb/GECG01007280.1/~~gb/GECG01007280.1/.p1  ORF type:complete len:110 (+),score=8.01 gb/GECG01007280.1/:1-330(+)